MKCRFTAVCCLTPIVKWNRSLPVSREPFQAEGCEDTDESSGQKTRKVQKRKIGQDSTESYETGRYDKLTKVMADTTHDTYSRCGEVWVFFIFHPCHHHQADDTAGQTI